jgi:hypothetical protein
MARLMAGVDPRWCKGLPLLQPSSPLMSRMSRRIMEGQCGTFLDRLQADIASREAKRQAAQQRSPSLPYIRGGMAAEGEQEARDLKYIWWVGGWVGEHHHQSMIMSKQLVGSSTTTLRAAGRGGWRRNT